MSHIISQAEVLQQLGSSHLRAKVEVQSRIAKLFPEVGCAGRSVTLVPQLMKC